MRAQVVIEPIASKIAAAPPTMKSEGISAKSAGFSANLNNLLNNVSQPVAAKPMPFAAKPTPFDSNVAAKPAAFPQPVPVSDLLLPDPSPPVMKSAAPLSDLAFAPASERASDLFDLNSFDGAVEAKAPASDPFSQIDAFGGAPALKSAAPVSDLAGPTLKSRNPHRDRFVDEVTPKSMAYDRVSFGVGESIDSIGQMQRVLDYAPSRSELRRMEAAARQESTARASSAASQALAVAAATTVAAVAGMSAARNAAASAVQPTPAQPAPATTVPAGGRGSGVRESLERDQRDRANPRDRAAREEVGMRSIERSSYERDHWGMRSAPPMYGQDMASLRAPRVRRFDHGPRMRSAAYRYEEDDDAGPVDL